MLNSRKQFLLKAGYALTGTFLAQSKILANVFTPPQRPVLNTISPSDCNQNLRTGNLFGINEVGNYDGFYYYKGAAPGNALDVLYYEDDNVADCVSPLPTVNSCNVSNNHITDESALRYKAYFPLNAAHDYATTPLPLIVLFHPGGFSECSEYDSSTIKELCKAFSQKGFIAITAQYRTGKVQDLTDLSKISVQQMLASYRTQQDVRGALRSIIKRDAVDGHSGLFKINTDQVFIGGLSAGGIAAMGAAYYRTQNMVNQVFPNSANSPLNIEEALGPIKADYYYGEDIPAYNVTIRGLLICWGGIAIPHEYDGNEQDFFAGGSSLANPPMIAFHGAADTTIPYFDNSSQDFHFSTDADYKKEKLCLNEDMNFVIKKPTNLKPVSVKQGSSLNMYNILAHPSIDRFTELYVDCLAGHGLGGSADFGTGNPDPVLVAKYIVQRAAIFFQTIMNHSSLSTHPAFGIRGRSLFRDCENKRICTQTGDNNTCTSANDIECDM